MKVHGVETHRLNTRYGAMYAPKRDSVIGRSLELYGEWAENEIEALAALAQDGDVILDVGANIGTHTLAFALRFPHSPVVAMEPQPLTFALLAANAAAFGLGDIRPMNVACGAKRGLTDFLPDYAALDWNFGAARMTPEALTDSRWTNPVQIVRIDDLVLPGRVGLIKIDVEGMEPSVLAGAVDLIRRDQPFVAFEVLEIPVLEEALAILRPLEYELRWLQTDAFNPENFNGVSENIWALGEALVVAGPKVGAQRIRHLPLVTGNESEPPRPKSRDIGAPRPSSSSPLRKQASRA